MITYQIGCVRYLPKTWKFPAGEVGIAALPHSSPSKVDVVHVIASIQSSDEVMQLLMLTDALKRQFFNAKIRLRLGYTPYGRQDRVCNEGEALSIAVFASLINSQNYDQVLIVDPHSDVTTALFNQVVVVKQDEVFREVFGDRYDFHATIVAPDVGASKKAAVIGEMTQNQTIFASKQRNLATGEIIGLSFSGEVEGKNVVIVDDIADGCATFLNLGAQLKNAGINTMVLMVTHGIFSKGTKELTELYDAVYTTNTYHQDREGWIDGVYYTKLI